MNKKDSLDYECRQALLVIFLSGSCFVMGSALVVAMVLLARVS